MNWAPVIPVILRAVPPRNFGYSTGWRKFLGREAPDIVHVQGLWIAQGPVALSWRMRTAKPYIVRVRGDAGAVGTEVRGWKKGMALWAWERRVLTEAACCTPPHRMRRRTWVHWD